MLTIFVYMKSTLSYIEDNGLDQRGAKKKEPLKFDVPHVQNIFSYSLLVYIILEGISLVRQCSVCKSEIKYSVK